MKLKLTESQFNRLQNKLNESISGKEYSYKVKLDINFDGDYLGKEIVDISDVYVTLNYDIHVEFKQWGIGGIYFGDIVGPSEIEIEIEYAIDGDYDTKKIEVSVPFDWSKLEKEEITGSKSVSIGDKLEVYLSVNEDGIVFVKRMEIPIYTM
jgi:hypothetical protein